MSEQAKGKTRPEIKGKVLAIMPEWRNDAGTFVKREVVVETGDRFPNPVKVTFKKDNIYCLDNIAEGDEVIIPYALHGNKWDGPKGTQFFVDVVGLAVRKIVASDDGAAQAETKTVVGCTWETAVKTWKKYHGDDIPSFAEFCRQRRPDIVKLAAETKQMFSSIAKKRLDVCADIVNAIEADAQKADAPDGPADDDPDNLPF